MAAPVTAVTPQVAAVLGRSPDVIALQELTLASYPQWCDALLGEGFSVASTIDLVRAPYPTTRPPIRRRYFNAIAARGAVAPLPGLDFTDPEQARVAFPEKYLAARVVIDATGLELHNAHLPPGSTRGVIKPQAFSAIRRRTDAVSGPIVLCGDFNTPQREDATSVTTWASSHPALCDEWDAAERSVLENPRLRDVYRELRDVDAPFAASHFTGRPHDAMTTSTRPLTFSRWPARITRIGSSSDSVITPRSRRTSNCAGSAFTRSYRGATTTQWFTARDKPTYNCLSWVA